MITVENRQPVRTRSAWRPADFPTPDAYSFPIASRRPTGRAGGDRVLDRQRTDA